MLKDLYLLFSKYYYMYSHVNCWKSKAMALKKIFFKYIYLKKDLRRNVMEKNRIFYFSFFPSKTEVIVDESMSSQ